MLRRALELGINFIDTADSYGPEVSERLIAEALHPYPEGLVIATKAGLRRPGPDQWREDGRPEYLRGQVESSLQRLRLDRIDLLQLHRIDPKVPLEDQIGALVRLQQEGKIRHLGVSEVTLAQLEAARRLADDRQRPEPLQPGQPEERGRARVLRKPRGSGSSPGSRSRPAILPRLAARSLRRRSDSMPSRRRWHWRGCSTVRP